MDSYSERVFRMLDELIPCTGGNEMNDTPEDFDSSAFDAFNAMFEGESIDIDAVSAYPSELMARAMVGNVSASGIEYLHNLLHKEDIPDAIKPHLMATIMALDLMSGAVASFRNVFDEAMNTANDNWDKADERFKTLEAQVLSILEISAKSVDTMAKLFEYAMANRDRLDTLEKKYEIIEERVGALETAFALVVELKGNKDAEGETK